ncbi:MAG: ribonuclease Z [Clostridia bacterium]|nr:ribonuclease Z [Clostridia bacterium]
MKIHLLGSCSGTEPIPGRHHTAFAVERGGALYWFDAGETCAHTAHVLGLDLLAVRHIVISHTHMDHIGGLGNLLWTMRKLDGRAHRLAGETIFLHLPDLRAWDAVRSLLSLTEGGFRCEFAVEPRLIQDGPVFQAEGLRVEALHTHHLPHEPGQPWRAFGFAIEADGRRVVYTGDTGGYEDYAPLLAGGCDVLLHETGHHHPAEVAKRLLDEGAAPGLLAFMHHGRDILNHPDEQRTQLAALPGLNWRILDDGDAIEV